jgi:hypothetical protein
MKKDDKIEVITIIHVRDKDKIEVSLYIRGRV